jgi:hypothetical protein
MYAENDTFAHSFIFKLFFYTFSATFSANLWSPQNGEYMCPYGFENVATFFATNLNLIRAF